MPLYEYYCSDCNETFEALRPMAEADTVITCSDCGGEHTSRALSLIAAPQIGKDFPELNSATAHGACACGGTCGCR